MVEGGGGSVIAAFFLAHNYVSEQFGNYVEYGMPISVPLELRGFYKVRTVRFVS